MKNIIKLSLCFAVAMSFAPEAFAKGGGSCTAKIVNKCKSAGRAIGETGDMSVTGLGAREGGTLVGGAATERGRRMGVAAGECQASASECDKCPPAEREQCKKAVGDAAGDMKAQSAGMGDAGAMMGAIAGLAAAMLPMLMKKDEEEEEKQQQNPNSALQCGQNGCTIDCSKNDAYNYAQCDAQLAASCMNAMSDWRCVNFANRYCNGTGVGSPYCNRAVAYQFCSPGGRDLCPSCLQLQKETSPGCVANPAACIGQNSPEETERMRATCPQDPVFAGAGNAGFGGVAGGLPAPGPVPVAGPTPNPGLPPPILPAGTNGGTGGTGGTTGGGGTGTIVTSSVGGGRDSYKDKITGGLTAKQEAAAGQGGGGYGAQSAGGGDVGGTGGRDTAGTGGYKPASTGPAPDVNGQYGPSLFTTASQIIRNRCAEAKFFHCP